MRLPSLLPLPRCLQENNPPDTKLLVSPPTLCTNFNVVIRLVLWCSASALQETEGARVDGLKAFRTAENAFFKALQVRVGEKNRKESARARPEQGTSSNRGTGTLLTPLACTPCALLEKQQTEAGLSRQQVLRFLHLQALGSFPSDDSEGAFFVDYNKVPLMLEAAGESESATLAVSADAKVH